MAKIIGIINTSFKPKDATTPIEGQTLYVSEPIDHKHGQGVSCDHFFISKAKLSALDFCPAVGQEIEPLYNKFGRLHTLRLLDENIDFGVEK